MNIEDFFKQEKGITIDNAFKSSAKYTAVDICRFAQKFYEEKSKESFSSREVDEITSDVMNLGMDLRQKQLNGRTDKSGNQVLAEYMKDLKVKKWEER